MAYTGLPKVPEGFTSLADAWSYPLRQTGERHNCNMIGVCTDFLECCKTRGTDYSMKITLHDPYYTDGIGMTFQMFVKDPSQAPAVKNQGDIVIFRNAGTVNSPKMGKFATTNLASTWAVIEHASLSNSNDLVNLTIHRSDRGGRRAPAPSREELQYAKAILALEDPSRWQAPARSTTLQVNATIAASGGTPTKTSRKHRVISDLDIPVDNRQYVDLTAEVRRYYETDLRLEICLTDYTENQNLYKYAHGQPGDDTLYDHGDRFGYSANSHTGWPGPWGKQTMTVVLWEPHRTFALKNIKLGDLVHIRNVHLKMDTLGSKLEGVLHGDNLNPDKILISRLRPADAGTNDDLKDLLRRKRAHEDHCKNSGLPFIRDANPAKLKNLTASEHAQKDDPILEPNPAEHKDGKSKKNRKKKEKQRAKNAAKVAASGGQPGQALRTEHNTGSSLAPNAHIRTNTSAASLIRIDTILNPTLLERTSPHGNKWLAPFQNCRYKSKVQVVDYYPRNLTEFAVKIRPSQYAELSDSESLFDDEASATASDSDAMDVDSPTGSAADGDDDNGSRWEWRFVLVVEDATATRAGADATVLGLDRRRLELVVSGADAEYLLREEACNLRRNPKALARLKEKLFVLWGDLQERMEEEEDEQKKERGREDAAAEGRRLVAGDGGQQGEQRKARSQPFECYIDEYGVKREGTVGNKVEDWARCWRLLHTTVA